MADSMLHNRLRANLIVAKASHDKNSHMSVLTDANGHKTAQKLYHQYISDSDYSKLPAFVQGLDSLLASFGAGQNEGGADEDEQADKAAKPDKNNNNSSKDNSGDDDDDNQRDKF